MHDAVLRLTADVDKGCSITMHKMHLTLHVSPGSIGGDIQHISAVSRRQKRQNQVDQAVTDHLKLKHKKKSKLKDKHKHKHKHKRRRSQ